MKLLRRSRVAIGRTPWGALGLAATIAALCALVAYVLHPADAAVQQALQCIGVLCVLSPMMTRSRARNLTRMEFVALLLVMQSDLRTWFGVGAVVGVDLHRHLTFDWEWSVEAAAALASFIYTFSVVIIHSLFYFIRKDVQRSMRRLFAPRREEGSNPPFARENREASKHEGFHDSAVEPSENA